MNPLQGAGLATVLLVGCASSQPDLSKTDRIVQDVIGQRATWVEGPGSESALDATVHAALGGELSVDDAIRVALLRNMELQAIYEDVGIAEANLVAASLPKNPTLEVDALFPDRAPRGTGIELEFAQDLLSVFMIPARRALAHAELAQTQALVTSEVIELAAKVRSAYYTLQGAMHARSVRERAAETAGASLEYALALHQAGNLPDLELARQRALLAETRVELGRVELEVIDGRERLNGLMGLWGEETAWTLPAQLPELPADDLSTDRLESLAVTQRFDLQAASDLAAKLARALDLAGTFRWTPGLALGVASDRDSDGQWSIGPHLEVTLPVYDHGQADVARLMAQLRQAEKRYAALAVNVRADVRRVGGRLVVLHDLARSYREGLLPARREVLQRALEQYNFMLLGTFELLEAKQDEVGAELQYVETLEEYWVTRSELARVLGGRLADGQAIDFAAGPSSGPRSGEAPEPRSSGQSAQPGQGAPAPGHQGH